MAADGSLVFLRSAGERGEAEAISAEVVRLLAGGSDPSEIAIVLRDPQRRGPLLASVLESYGVPVALEAEVPVAATAVGGGLIAMLETIVGSARSADLLRYLRLASGITPGVVDSFERSLRRGRVQSASAAIELWEERFGDLPRRSLPGPGRRPPGPGTSPPRSRGPPRRSPPAGRTSSNRRRP